MNADHSPPPAEVAAWRGAGRVLRVKQGYNPNSSSMGSIVFALPLALLGASAIFGAVAAAVFASLLERGGPLPHGSRAKEEAGAPRGQDPEADS